MQGTAAKLLINALKDNESIVIPASLSDPENGWTAGWKAARISVKANSESYSTL